MTTDPTAGSLTGDLADGPAGDPAMPVAVGNHLLNHVLLPNHGQL